MFLTTMAANIGVALVPTNTPHTTCNAVEFVFLLLPPILMRPVASRTASRVCHRNNHSIMFGVNEHL